MTDKKPGDIQVPVVEFAKGVVKLLQTLVKNTRRNLAEANLDEA